MLLTYQIALFLSSLVGVIYFGKLHSALKPMVIMLVYTAVHEVVVHQEWLPNNNQAYWLYTGISSGLYLEFMRRSILNAVVKCILIILTFGFVAAGIIFSITIGDVFPSSFINLTIPFMVLGSLMVLYSILKNVSDQPLSSNPIFITTAAILIYQCVFFTYLGSLNFLMDNGQLTDLLMIIFNIASIIYYSALGYAFLLSIRNMRKIEAT